MKKVDLPFIYSLEKNLSSTPQFLQVILGPRQVGKTTTVLHFFETRFKGEFLYVTADQTLSIKEDWILLNWQEARRKNAVLIIDEIQKIDNWPSIIKRLWDEEKRREKPIRTVLLGSSSLKIQKGLVESLAGRYQLIPVFHWNFNETKKIVDISFDEFLQFGGYPGSYALLKDTKEWRNYLQHSIVEAVIEKDILSFHSVKSPALFKQTFELLK